MLSNVVDIETDAMRVSLEAPARGIILFDFRAAFPSLSHHFLFRVIRALGLPAHAIHFLEALYNDNKCTLTVGGCLHDGFGMHAGIRQGCP